MFWPYDFYKQFYNEEKRSKNGFLSDLLGVSEDKLIIGAPVFHGEWGW